MMVSARGCALVLVVTASMLHPAPGWGESRRATGVRAFVGARVIDGTGSEPIENAAVIVRDGRIEAVGPVASTEIPDGADVIDVAGKTITPGLVNAHGHLGEVRGLESKPEYYTTDHLLDQLGLYARYGVTTVFSLGGDKEPAFKLRDAQATPDLDRARVFVAGPVVTSGNPAAARLMTSAIADMKADFVKIRVDDNLGTTQKMPPMAYQIVLDIAHRRGLRLASHIFYLEDAKALLEAGSDFIAHSIRDTYVDDEVIELLKARDVCMCPTLTRELSTFVYESRPDFFDDPFFLREADPDVIEQLLDPERQQKVKASETAQGYKAALQVASRNLKTLSDAGVRIAFGTDTGPAARFQGYFEHVELEMMAEAGLTPMQIIKAATGDAATCWQKEDELGTLQPGRWADLIVLTENPLDDIRNMRGIESVWIAGNRVADTR